MIKRKQKGIGLFSIMLALSALAVFAVIGGGYLTSINIGNSKANLISSTLQIINQSANVIATESNNSGSLPIAPVPLLWNGSRPTSPPALGTASVVGLIPTASLAVKIDAWGNNLAYCTKVISVQSEVLFSLVSPGADGIFQTTCTQALLGNKSGDDISVAKSAISVDTVSGGTVYYASPVATLTDLANISTVQVGEKRMVLSTHGVYINATGVAGAANWKLNQSIPIVVENASCAGYENGNIGKDIAGDLYSCKAGYWIRLVISSVTTPTPPPIPPAPPSIATTGVPPNKIFSWGTNGNGQLGINTVIDTYVPTQEATLSTNWVTVSANGTHSLAIRSDGTLWAWGDNAFGKLGDGTTVQKNSPVQIGTSTNWAVVCGSDSSNYSLGLKTDGTLWVWGVANTIGVNSNIPIQRGSGYSKVYCGFDWVVLIKADGTLWSFGQGNNYGQQGNGTTVNNICTSIACNPSQIGTDNQWVKVSTGYYHNLAIKADGTLWGWGLNANSQIGDGTVTQQNLPVQIGVSTTWVDVSAGGFGSIGIQADGTAWVWGLLASSHVSSNVTNKVPTRFGSGTNWLKAYAIGLDNNQAGVLLLKSTGELYFSGQELQGQTGTGVTSKGGNQFSTVNPINPYWVDSPNLYAMCAENMTHGQMISCIRK